MNPLLKFYLVGAVIALLMNLIFMLCAHKVRVSNILGYILNTALSWGMLITLLLNYTVGLLEQYGLNKTLWTSAEYKKQEELARKMHKSQHPSLPKKSK